MKILRSGASLPVGVMSLLLVMAFPASTEVFTFLAWTALALSAGLVWRWRKNAAALIIATVMGYFNYSVIVAEYLLPDAGLTSTLNEARTVESLAIGLNLMVVILAMLITLPKPPEKFELTSSSTRGDTIAYIVSLSYLTYVGIFAIDRAGVSGQYETRISPLYEYAFIVAMLGYFACGDSRGRRMLLTALIFVLAAQDAYYGGRITTFQLLIVLVLCLFAHRVNIRSVSFLALSGILFGTFVAVLRSSSSAGRVEVRDALIGLREGLFVSDTAAYSYYATLTHIQARADFSPGESDTLLEAFLKQIFVGGQSDLMVTKYVSVNHFQSLGGGFFFSHFYVFGGYVGAFVGFSLLCLVLTKAWARRDGSIFASMLFVGVAASSPRWYLYTPATLFRSLLVAAIIFGLVKFWMRSFSTPQNPTRRIDPPETTLGS